LLVEAIDCFLRVSAVEELDEREPSGPAGFPIDRKHNL